jgi:hypothetical protein
VPKWGPIYTSAPSMLDRIFSIIARAMTGEHLSLIGSLAYLYLPEDMMIVERS